MLFLCAADARTHGIEGSDTGIQSSRRKLNRRDVCLDELRASYVATSDFNLASGPIHSDNIEAACSKLGAPRADPHRNPSPTRARRAGREINSSSQ